MTEWWTYGLSDFLMFSPQAYWRMVARYNAAWWPAQALAAGVALALPWLAWQGRAGSGRAALALLALAWAWVGWGFQAQRYAEIFIAGPALAAASAAQALLLLAACALPVPREPRARALGAPATLLLGAALLYPLLARLTGHPWREAEVFGFMPEPTALATLGVLATPAAGPRWRCCRCCRCCSARPRAGCWRAEARRTLAIKQPAGAAQRRPGGQGTAGPPQGSLRPLGGPGAAQRRPWGPHQ